ncbi:MAG: hypothetical protein OXD54_00465 [Candidatus Poribacteria bacterium]|nr:hypothetical protein [Candidatus Poribacteria bacterium]
MKYTWKVGKIVKTSRDLRHNSDTDIYIPKDTIIKIIEIDKDHGYKISTAGSRNIQIDAITSNDAFLDLTELEIEMILDYGVESANKLIMDRYIEIKTYENLNYIKPKDLHENSHCPECDSRFKRRSDYFMRVNETPHKIRDSSGHYFVCKCEGKWVPTSLHYSKDINQLGNLSESIADPLLYNVEYLIHEEIPTKTNGKRSWRGVHYLREYLEDSCKHCKHDIFNKLYILYNDFVQLKRNSGAIYILRIDKNRSRIMYGGDGLSMSSYQIQMNSSPSFWNKHLALLISESVLCITRNNGIWRKMLPNNENLEKELMSKAKRLIDYRNEILVHSDPKVNKEIGTIFFLRQRYNPQTNRQLLDNLLKEASNLYAKGLIEINKKYDLDIEPEVFREYYDLEDRSLEPIGEGILLAPTNLLEMLKILEQSIIMNN